MAEHDPADEAVNVTNAPVQISSSGPSRWGGMIAEDFLPELQWPRAYKIYDEMRKNSPIVGGFTRAIEAAFRSVQWPTIPYDDTPEGLERAKFLEECMADMNRPWTSVQTDILSVIPFGFAPMEMVFKFRMGRDVERPVSPSKFTDGKIGIKDLVLIPQNSIMEWIWDEYDPNFLVGLKQLSQDPNVRDPIVEIPMTKIVNFRVQAEKDNPEGLSVLRQAYRPYYFMTSLEVIEAISLERFGIGIPVISLPENATTIEQDANNSDEYKARQVVRKTRTDEQGGIVEPSGWKFRIESTNGMRAEIFDLAIKRHRANMLMSVLAVFLELGTSRVGSNAMARTGKSFFSEALEGWVSMVQDTFNEKVVPLLFELNGITDERLPKLSHTTLAGEDLEVIITAVEKLAAIQGIEIDTTVKDHLRGLLRIPRGGTLVEREGIQPEGEEQDARTDEGAPVDPTLEDPTTQFGSNGAEPATAIPSGGDPSLGGPGL